MRRKSPRRDFISLVVSGGLHVGLVLALALIPKESKRQMTPLDMEVVRTNPEERVEPEPPEPEEEPEEIPKEIEPEKPRPKKIKKATAPPPEEAVEQPDPEPPPSTPPDADKADEKAEEAPPVFDLGDNTFAQAEGQGAAWSLNRSEGNTKFAGVAKKDTPSVRGTKPQGSPDGVPGGKGIGYRPIPLKNLAKRPKPRREIPTPPYPTEARREGIEGAVVLQVFIDRTGKVRRARIIKDPGGGLGLVAQKSMLAVKWTPPIDRNGKPVDTVIIYSYRFVLDG